ILSAQTSTGRALMIVVFLLNIGTLGIFFINLAEAEHLNFSFPDGIVYVDKCFNVFFLFYFGLRFVAADDKLRFWLELNSFVDFFTIPPVFISYFLKRDCFGLRFLRALRLLDLPRILQILRITTNNYSIKLSKLLAVFVSTWLTAAGFIHLVENNGDPWVQPANSQPLTYFKCMYLVIVTMSTVGYGDIVVQTTSGRSFIFFFIIGGLVLFANLIPEFVEIVESHKRYKSSYQVMSGKNYIVVCGNITLESVTTFLQDFLRQDKGNVCTEILFLGESLPSLELEAVFKCHSPYTSFFHGSALNSEDLKRVAMESANACLILADVCSPKPDVEDTSNIMRVLSIKNLYPKTRIILQIIQSCNKAYLPNIPSWDWRMGDSIICFAELKLGFMAQSCMVPGLSTLLTSLFLGKENTEDKMLPGDKDYKVMTSQLSNDFAGLTFKEVCWLCFVKLNLVLLGIEVPLGRQGESTILINPSPHRQLHRNTVGFFIAHSLAEVKRAYFYCKACHDDIHDPELIEKCQCRSRLALKSFSVHILVKRCCLQTCVSAPDLQTHSVQVLAVFLVFWAILMKDISLSTAHARLIHSSIFFSLEIGRSLYPGEELNYYLKKKLKNNLKPILNKTTITKKNPNPPTKPNDEGDDTSRVTLDSTGRFHWCEAVPLLEAILSLRNQPVLYLQDHILVCVFGDALSPLIGLQDFVMPLRTSNFLRRELKDIIFLASMNYMKREWKFIQNFPKLWLFCGSALSCADLQAVNVLDCAACVILSSNAPASSNHSLVDTESILATLNVRSMETKSCSVKVGGKKNIDIRERYPGNDQTHSNQLVQRMERHNTGTCKRRIPITTELKFSPNAHFVNQAPSSNSATAEQGQPSSAAAPAGDIFSDSFLNSLLSMTYYNHRILALLQTLVTNRTCPAAEKQLDNKVEKSSDDQDEDISHVRCKLALLPLSKCWFSDAKKENCFRDVYCTALDVFGILCFGLYRLMEDPNPCNNSLKLTRLCCFRFVIARPASDLKMMSTDLLFCIVPFN
ncbi:KCMA1 protein, partial [Penelope pileata]|nr:KCMA1 protein [Penelope pileata]